MADTVVWALKTGDMDVVKANLVTVRKPKRVIQRLAWKDETKRQKKKKNLTSQCSAARLSKPVRG